MVALNVFNHFLRGVGKTKEVVVIVADGLVFVQHGLLEPIEQPSPKGAVVQDDGCFVILLVCINVNASNNSLCRSPRMTTKACCT